MDEQNQKQQPKESGFSDEPHYRCHPLEAFDTKYDFDGQTFAVKIQGLEKKDANLDSGFRYRVTYENGDEIILVCGPNDDYIEGSALTDHAAMLGECIYIHFMEEAIFCSYE